MRAAVVLDRASSSPLHRQIYDQWRYGILTGRFRRAERVPSTRELCAALEVSRSTVTQAYDQLIAEGYLEPTQGSGTFVCRELPDDLVTAAPDPPAAGRENSSHPALALRRRSERRFLLSASAAGVHSLHAMAAGSHALLAFDLAQAGDAAAASAAPELFDYAEQCAGYEPLRNEIAAYVSRSRAVRCTPDQVIIVNGSAQGIDLCVRLLLEPGDEVAIENPGYHGAHRIFAGYGARLRAARVDEMES